MPRKHFSDELTERAFALLGFDINVSCDLFCAECYVSPPPDFLRTLAEAPMLREIDINGYRGLGLVRPSRRPQRRAA